MTQIKLNLPMNPSTFKSSKRFNYLQNKLTNRSSLWIVLSYKLELGIIRTIALMTQKMQEVENNIKVVESGEEIPPLHNEQTELMLAREYEHEIDKLKEMVEESEVTKDEVKFRNGVVAVLMDKLKHLMYLIGKHKKRLLDWNIRINHLRQQNIAKKEKEEIEELKTDQNDNFKNRTAQLRSRTITDKSNFKLSEEEGEKKQGGLKQKQMLMEKVEDEMENIQDTQNTLHELSELMNNFSMKIVEQDEVVTTIMHDAEEANVNIKEAGKELKKAHEYQKGYDKIVAGLYIIMAILILAFDRVSAIHYY
jgi:t-SNARE complex subunit (syntaxin)